MKKYVKQICLFALIAISCSTIKAQEFRWKAGFDFIGDNREFTTYYGYPETILLSRVSGEIGAALDSNQSIMAGGSYAVEHGEEMFAHTPTLTLYYRFKNKILDFQLGCFPIEKATFPKVLYTDSLIYYRPNYQGARGIITHKFGEQTLLFDWHTQRGAGYCEKFIAGLSGTTHLGNFFITDMFYYRHHAEGERGKKSVADNGGWGINLGFDVRNTWFDSLSVSTGFVNTWYSNLKDTTFVSPLRSIASYSTFYIEKKFLAIDALYYYGEGTHLPWGDPLFRCGNYARIDGVLYVFRRESIEASFRWCMHYLDGVWDNSQQIYLRARIGSKTK